MSALVQPSDPELLLLKQAKLRLKQQRLRAMQRDGLPFYRPHAKQDSFHRSTKRRRGVFSGNRFGKSHAGMAEDSAWLRGERLWLTKGDPGRTAGIPMRPVKGLVLVNDWDIVKGIFTGQDGKLWKFLPRDLVASTTRNHSGAVDSITVKGLYGPSTLRFDTVKSFLSNPQGSESADWDFIHVDEPIPVGMWKATSRGLIDRHGSAWFLLTNTCEPWITDAFAPEGEFASDCFVVEGTIYDNPHNSQEAIALYAASLTEDERECRLYGKALHKAGLVYKQFQRDVHVLSEVPKDWKSFMEPPKDWPHYYYIDPHARIPHMVQFWVVDPHGRRYVYYDIFRRCLISELCDEMKTILDKDTHIVRGRIDPIACIEDQISGSSWKDEFGTNGFPVDKAIKDPQHGICRVQDELTTRGSDGKAIPSNAKLVFCPTARRTLWEIERFAWDPETNKPVDTDDHAMECLYRAILDEPCWLERNTRFGPIEDIVITSPRFDLDERVDLSMAL